MKKILMVLLIGMLVGAGGCESIKLDGFSIGAVYLNADMVTTSSFSNSYWKTTDTQTGHIKKLLPTFSLNFKFK